MNIILFNTTFTDNYKYDFTILHRPSGCDHAVSASCNIDNVIFTFKYQIPQEGFSLFVLHAITNKGIEFLLRTKINMDCMYIPNRFSKEITGETVDLFDEEKEQLCIPVLKEEWLQIAAAKFEQKFTDYPLGYPFNLLKLSIFQ